MKENSVSLVWPSIRNSLLIAVAAFMLTAHPTRAEETSIRLPKPAVDADYREHSKAKIRLGQLLFYDRVLSGTYRVSCATCHNHDRASSNGELLPGRREQKADDLAINGLPLYDPLKPSTRHAPALFNLGAREFTAMFSDGRVARAADGTIISPAGSELPKGVENVVAAQALFPFVASDELVGTVDNELRDAAKNGHPAIWDALMKRLRELEGYEPMFKAAYPKLQNIQSANISHVANAIGAFVSTEWRADNAPFDRYLRGEKAALTQPQIRGMGLFYGKAGCSTCHAGPFQTDHEFHGTGLPLWRFDEPFVRGKDGKLGMEPLNGRESVTGNKKNRFHFRTPSLRNVDYTAPYGWAGSHKTLEDFVRDHADPYNVVIAFVAQGIGGFSPPDHLAKNVDDALTNQTIKPVELKQTEIHQLISFLRALTDKTSLQGRLGKPTEVPSGLALD